MTTGFPQIALAIKVELLINGSWTDISAYVYQRDAIVITGGQADEGSTSQPAQAAITLNNRDGRFSPSYTGGAYYPYLVRNTQLRISVNTQSTSGNTYSGYRFWGEVPSWPPQWDPSGSDIYVQILASGPLRRINQGGGEGSALARYYGALTGSFTPIAYWPCEEDPDTTIIGAGIDGGTNMSVTTGTPKFKAISDFNGSAPIGILNNSTWDGLTGAFGSSGDDIYTTPGTYTWVSSVSSVNAKVWGSGGAGGANAGGGGGGGEFAQETTLAVTVGNSYTFTVPAGGSPVASSDGNDGASCSFAGDSVTVTANGGKGGKAGPNGGTVGAGGTGSTNAVHHNGGAGGAGTYPNAAGGGGGGSGGTSAAGNVGGSGFLNTGGGGAVAVTGGGPGGNGASTGQAGNLPVSGPGGGGGAASTGPTHPTAGAGYSGKVELVYTPQTTATTNVIRFILLVPSHGGNNAKVLLRAKTGSAVLDHLDVTYVTGGKLRLQGFNSSNVQQFDSTAQSWGVDGKTVMVSVELVNSGANVAWKFKSITPGATSLLGTTSGTVTTAAVGNVSEVIVAPNADITTTAMGHISVQYALVDLLQVSNALNGHTTEMSVDRFIRLANEQALNANPEYNETADHWGFETGTQSWVATNGAVSQSTAYASDGTHSLLLTANGGGNPSASSPTGTSGQPVNVGDIVSVGAEIMAPTSLTKMFLGIKWYTAAGAACAHAEDDTSDTAMTANVAQTFKVTATAPATAAFFAVVFGDHNTDANTTLMYVDNVRVSPRMGTQTRKAYKEFLKEVETLDAGILKEAKDAWGLKYRTRIRLINQTAAVTLDYSAATLTGQLTPVVDDKNTKNHIIVHRHKGSKVEVTLNTGTMSVSEPPAGAGRYKKRARVVAELDQQLLNLANHLLTLGTVTDERYPTISVSLARTEVASQMSAIASVEIGDFVKITNLPFYAPQATAKQLVIGYTETLNAFQWDIVWNCTPESPYEISAVNIRRW